MGLSLGIEFPSVHAHWPLFLLGSFGRSDMLFSKPTIGKTAIFEVLGKVEA